MSMIPADRLTNTEYHAKKDHISSSDVKMVHSKSLAHWKAKPQQVAGTLEGEDIQLKPSV